MKAVNPQKLVSIKNILFPTDFSSAAYLALPFAVAIARSYGAKVHVLHVTTLDRHLTSPPASWPGVSVSKSHAEAGTRQLSERLSGVRHRVVIEEGDVGEIIPRFIEKNKIDLVVAGTHGRTGLRKAVLGSVAELIFRRSSCPVLIVGPQAIQNPQALVEMREILYAADWGENSVATSYAISLARGLPAHLTLMNVIERATIGQGEQARRLVETIRQMLRRLVPSEADPWCAPKFVVERGEAAEKILEVANKNQADLIVLGLRRTSVPIGIVTNLANSTAYKVASRSTCPVLAVRG